MPTPGLAFSSTVISNDAVSPPDPNAPHTLGLQAADSTHIGLEADALLVRLPAVVGTTAPVGKIIDWVGTVRP